MSKLPLSLFLFFFLYLYVCFLFLTTSPFLCCKRIIDEKKKNSPIYMYFICAVIL